MLIFFFLGFRYELFCVAKYARSTHCVIHCDASVKDALKFNNMKTSDEKYSEEVLQGRKRDFNLMSFLLVCNQGCGSS